ncbi:MAG: retropepsin-like domain-containing protein [Spirochaetaceae bacterium]|jgi:predicted aspartyl protease|nr:retropepsin-like domain-containing protein [Spirochaetaceae bacterium]
MVQVFTDITLKNAGDVILAEHGYKQEQEIRRTTVNILVDTGAGTLVITEAMQRELGLKARAEKPVRMANNASVNVKEADPAEVHWKNRSMVCRPWVIPGAQKALLGLISLEDMDLMADPNGQTVVGAHDGEQIGILYYLVSVHKVGYFAARPCIFSPKGCENAFFKVVCP